MTLCHVIDGDNVLLKMATRGVSEGRWNAPGGKIDEGETPENCAIREVLEETGLRIRDLKSHGVINFHMDGKNDIVFIVHLFSTKNFSGSLNSTEEGEVRWFRRKDIPLERMWDDDNYWLDFMFQGRRFNADFYFDKENKKVIKYGIEFLD